MATVLLSLRSSALQRATATLLACNMKCCTLIDSSGKLSNKQYRVLRAETHRKNRRDPDLERKARLEQLFVPLDEVKRDWLDPRGKATNQLQTIGIHDHIYQDVFGIVFRPLGFLEVCYMPLHHVKWGDVMPAKNMASAPVVSLPKGLKGKYASLIMTNPDGHLQDSTKELLHWFVINIPLENGCGEFTRGQSLIPYLPPVPPKGTGFHRYVFSLYTHSTPLPSNSPYVGVAKKSWLQERLFSSVQFLRDGASVEGGITPWTFCFCQTQWDNSVHHTYQNILKWPEPVFAPERKLRPHALRKIEVNAARQSRYINI